jgi:hypothetical protein
MSLELARAELRVMQAMAELKSAQDDLALARWKASLKLASPTNHESPTAFSDTAPFSSSHM